MSVCSFPREFREDFGVYCCSHVFQLIRPVLIVVRDPDGMWQFLCGQCDASEDCHLIGVEHLLAWDVTLGPMAELAISSGAERENPKAEWSYPALEEGGENC